MDRVLIDKCKDDSEKVLFYVRKIQENNWSRAVLLNFLDTDLYERQGKAVSNFSLTLSAPQGDLAQAITSRLAFHLISYQSLFRSISREVCQRLRKLKRSYQYSV